MENRPNLSPQGTHGTEAEVLLSVVIPACAWQSLMIYIGDLVFSSAINLWVETHWTLWNWLDSTGVKFYITSEPHLAYRKGMTIGGCGFRTC